MKAKDIKNKSKSFIQWAETEERAKRLKNISAHLWKHVSEETEVSTAELYELYLEQRIKPREEPIEKKSLDINQLLEFLEEKMEFAHSQSAVNAYTIVYDYVKKHTE